MKKYFPILFLSFLFANVLLAQKKDSVAIKIQIDYDTLIARGDRDFKIQEWGWAYKEYHQASKFKPNEKYPIEQCKKIKEITAPNIVDHDESWMNYCRKTKSADSIFDLKQYEKAESVYYESHLIEPMEKRPMDRIHMIDDLIKIEKYKAAIAKADSAYEFHFSGGIDDAKHSKQYEQAKVLYQNASAIDPKENYPLERIKEIDRILFQIRNEPINIKVETLQLDPVGSTITSSDKILLDEEATILNKDSLKKFLDLIDKGEKHFEDFMEEEARDGYNESALTDASTAYKQALNIKKDSKYVEMLLKRIVDVEESHNKSPRIQYQNAIAKADMLFKDQKYGDAVSAYRDALLIKPNENYPKDMAVLSSKKYVEQHERNNFQTYIADNNINKLNIDMKTGMLTWNVGDEKKDRVYKIGEKRWNKFFKLGEVESKSKNNSEYSFHIPIDSAFYYLCVEYKDDSIVKGKGIDVPLIGDDVHTSTADSRDYTYFTKATRYEMYSKEGKIVKRGFGDKIYTGDLEPDVYYLNYGNMTVEFIKGKKK